MFRYTCCTLRVLCSALIVSTEFFKLAACIRNFVEVARNTWKVERAWFWVCTVVKCWWEFFLEYSWLLFVTCESVAETVIQLLHQECVCGDLVERQESAGSHLRHCKCILRCVMLSVTEVMWVARLPARARARAHSVTQYFLTASAPEAESARHLYRQVRPRANWYCEELLPI